MRNYDTTNGLPFVYFDLLSVTKSADRQLQGRVRPGLNLGCCRRGRAPPPPHPCSPWGACAGACAYPAHPRGRLAWARAHGRVPAGCLWEATGRPLGAFYGRVGTGGACGADKGATGL